MHSERQMEEELVDHVEGPPAHEGEADEGARLDAPTHEEGDPADENDERRRVEDAVGERVVLETGNGGVARPSRPEVVPLQELMQHEPVCEPADREPDDRVAEPLTRPLHAVRPPRLAARETTKMRRVIGAVVLAAGAATRFGSPKQAILVPRVLERVRASGVDEIVVVAGAHPLPEVGERVVECRDWERGPGASLRCGLAALGADVEAAVVSLADGPDLAPAAVDRVVAAWRNGAGDVVAAAYGGSRGHPVVLGRDAWNRVPDEGARALAAVLVPCDDLGPPGDVDTPADLR